MSVKQNAELSGANWMDGRIIPRYPPDGVLMASEGQKEY